MFSMASEKSLPINPKVVTASANHLPGYDFETLNFVKMRITADQCQIVLKGNGCNPDVVLGQITMSVSSRYLPFIGIHLLATLFNCLPHELQIVHRYCTSELKQLAARDAM